MSRRVNSQCLLCRGVKRVCRFLRDAPAVTASVKSIRSPANDPRKKHLDKNGGIRQSPRPEDLGQIVQLLLKLDAEKSEEASDSPI
jgi:hypothetical protein